MLNLQDTLINTIVDKGLLAFVVAAAGFWLNRILETHKAYEIRQTEFMKLRMQAMNNTWSAVYSWIIKCDKLLENNMPIIGDTDIGSFRKSVVGETEMLIEKISGQRFFCGELFTQDCLNFCNARLAYYMRYDGKATSCGNAPVPPWEDVVSVQDKYLK